MRDRQTGLFRSLGGDLRYGLRSLRQHPGLATTTDPLAALRHE